jgi:hypothetical protein
VQVIGVIIILVVFIMIMKYCGFDDMLFCCIYIDMCYQLGSLEYARL